MSQKEFTLTVFSDISPLPDVSGATVRLAGLLRGLSTAPGVVRVVLSCPVPETHRDTLVEWCTSHGIEVIPFGSCQGLLSWSPAERMDFMQHAERLLARTDAGNVVTFVFGQPLAVSLSSHASRFPMVADIIDELTPHLWGVVKRHLASARFVSGLKQYIWLRMYHRNHAALTKYRAIVITAHDDARRLGRLVPGLESISVPNGVDAGNAPPSFAERSTANAVFHGTLDYPPNEKSALFIAEEIAPLVPETRFDIVGRGRSDQLKRSLRKNPNVRIVGAVPSIAEILRAARFGVYPVITRTGIQNKVLEAWAHGLPVITTRRGLDVFRAFDRGVERAAICAESGKDFAAAMRALESNRQLAEELARFGRELVIRSFDWSSVGMQLSRICESTLSD